MFICFKCMNNVIHGPFLGTFFFILYLFLLSFDELI
jgi:hypothetical protein